MAMFFGNLDPEKYDRRYGDKQLVQRFWRYTQPYRRELIIIAVCLVFIAFISSAIPLSIAYGIYVLQEGTGFNSFLLVFGALVLVAVLDYGIGWLRRYLTATVIAKLISKMRQDAFAAAINRDLGFYDETKSGKVISRITSDTQEFSQVALLVADLFTQVIELTVLFVVLMRLNVGLTFVVLAWSPVTLLIAMGFRNWARWATQRGSRAMGNVNDNIQESVSGISVAKNFRQERMIYDEFVKINTQSYEVNLRRGFVFALVFPTLNGVVGFSISSVVYFGALAVIGGSIEAATWYLFLQSIDRLLFPLMNLAAFWSQLQQGFSALERIFGLIDAENTVVQTADVPPPKLRGMIRFQNVTFAYKPELPPVLKDFNLDIRSGESVAFVGHTGAGKTTIGKLITRFYEFQSGSILVDGHDIRSFNIPSYRRQLGTVPQQPFLFSGTIADNIRYGTTNASIDDVKRVAYSVGNGEWLETLPNGLDSDVGERGARLSMGQRQLVALLRVLLQRPSIFILDEATASVDPFTETQIQDALNMILAQSTSILIAHRLSTVRSADRIIVLRSGQIIEQGNHTQLMVNGGHYAELYNTYFRHQSLDYIENAKQEFVVG
jgi:ATP-binding cassette, subfamily B, bacterial